MQVDVTNEAVSEMVGRKPIYMISIFFYFIFIVPSALAPNIATLLASRMVRSPFSSTSSDAALAFDVVHFR